MKNQTCCFTGHRNVSDNFGVLKRKLKKTIIELIENGVIYYGSGGTIGFDTLASLAVLELKKKYPQIKLIMVLPCYEQEKMWSDADKKQYFKILEHADRIRYVSESYYSGCMHKRNRHLVDNSEFCICYLNSESGGTAYTVNYASRKGLHIINIYSKIKHFAAWL